MNQAPEGFRPWEISALVNERVVQQHAEEAQFLWSSRRRATGNVAFDLASLSALDRRLEAHLAGLLQAADKGWESCLEGLERATAGAVFTCAILAFSDSSKTRMRQTLLAATADVDLSAGLMSALAWIEPARVDEPIRLLSVSANALHRAIAIRARALQRDDSASVLQQALRDADPRVRAVALRGFGECMRRQSAPVLVEHLKDQDQRCRFWAAWSLALIAPNEHSAELLEFVDDDDPAVAYGATDLAVRMPPSDKAKELIRHLVNHSRWKGLAEAAVGALGDSSGVPWLIERLHNEAVARVAGASFCAITGVSLSKADLTHVGSADRADEGHPALGRPWMAATDGTPMPAASKVEKWWSTHRDAFPAGVRLLGGRPVDLPCALETLRTGNQLMRRSAALEVALRTVDSPLFEVRARGRYQEAQLRQWTS